MRPLRTLAPALALLAACGGTIDAPRQAQSTPLLAALASPEAPGTRALRAGRVGEARSSLEAALASDPDRMGDLNDLAVSYALQERFDAARQLLEEVLVRGAPREQQAALGNLGELYALDGYLPAAQAHLEAARAMDPAQPGPHYALAALADARGDRPGAQAALRDALRLDEGGAVRRELTFLHPEERVHLEALVAGATGDAATADARWRELRAGRFPALAAAAQRHLEER